MTVVLWVGLGWASLTAPVAVLLGRGIRLADAHAEAVYSTDGVERFLREQAAAPRS